MKTEISRDSHQPLKRYSGVYQQQGRMLTDADWNELVEIIKLRFNDALKDVLGSTQGSYGGTPRHRALKIKKDIAADPLSIQAGHIYVDGLAAQLIDNVEYENQTDFPSPAPLPTGQYIVYADVWERTVTQLLDERLRDKALHGADTCSRKQVMCQIKCSDVDPEQSSKNPHKGNAELSVTLLNKTTQPDSCDPCADQLDIESRIGNYLFRVEVHDVKGDADNPSEITLKWSSENAAEQYALKNKEAEAIAPPGSFNNDNWVYEFFDDISEKHMGVHRVSGFSPERELLTADYPASPPRDYVRRWDGYCTLIKNGSWVINPQFDISHPGPAAPTFADIDGTTLTINLDALKLELELNHAFVAGDFWLAEVREVEHTPDTKLLDQQTPQGIEHHYLTLGEVTADVLTSNPEADRKYAFPALTEMTRLFMAGGDGQEVVPGEALPQPLRVGVANGEYPVQGAKVRFEILVGGGSLTPASGIYFTNDKGIAECSWTPSVTPNADYQVKATLVVPDHVGGGDKAIDPPVYFYANLITADQVIYDNQSCGDATNPTLQSLFDSDGHFQWPDRDGNDSVSVKDVLDTLLCDLRSSHIPFYPEDCPSGVLIPTVKSGLGINTNTTIHDVLQKLICKLDAGTIPYDPNNQTSRWKDIKEQQAVIGDLTEPNTVQSAIDDLIAWLESTDIRYLIPACETVPTLRSLLPEIKDIANGTTVKIDKVLDKLLCDFKATHLPLDQSGASLCSELDDATSVQDALKILCDRKAGGGCAVTVGPGGEYTTLDKAFETLSEKENINICLLPGTHHVEKAWDITDKTSIKIIGGGSRTSIIFIKDVISLQAMDIILRDLTCTGSHTSSKDASTGHLILSAKGTGKCAVENCMFSRTFSGKDKQWKPVVSLNSNMLLSWKNNLMYALRVDEKVADAVTPKKDTLRGKALDASLALEAVWVTNPYDEESDFEDKLKVAAEKITGLSAASRTQFYKAREEVLINTLPDIEVDIGHAGGVVLEGRIPSTPSDPSAPTIPSIPSRSPRSPVPGGTPIPSIPSIPIRSLARTMRMLSVKPKTEVSSLYEDIKSATANNADKLIARIRVVAALMSPIDVALALETNHVEGDISSNSITGYVVLFSDQADGKELNWGLTKHIDNAANFKQSWTKGNDYLDYSGYLNIHDNLIYAVYSTVSSSDLKQLQQVVTLGAEAKDLQLIAYESVSVRDNVFLSLANSFIARSLKFSGNEFRLDNNMEDVVAYTLAYFDIFVGNLAMNEKAVIEHISQILRKEANILEII